MRIKSKNVDNRGVSGVSGALTATVSIYGDLPATSIRNDAPRHPIRSDMQVA